ncbi:MAG: DUF1802 family protein [Candidatus Bathyarchaeia archaeon]
MSLSEYRALKEWASVVRALDEGKQALLLRKGGIAEKEQEFRLKHLRFLLFPTYEHQDETSFQPEYRRYIRESESLKLDEDVIQLTNFATVEEVFELSALDRARALSKYHIWSDQFVKMKFNYRQEKPLNVMTLRVYRLPQSTPVKVTSKYRGCLSWINLDTPIPTNGSRPVLDDAQFSRVGTEIRECVS